MSLAHQASCDVRTHAAESQYAELHTTPPAPAGCWPGPLASLTPPRDETTPRDHQYRRQGPSSMTYLFIERALVIQLRVTGRRAPAAWSRLPRAVRVGRAEAGGPA